MKVTVQSGGSDCELIARAFATAILLTYKHFMQTINGSEISLFSITTKRRFRDVKSYGCRRVLDRQTDG